jgi:SAM-dependent methyltransferase
MDPKKIVRDGYDVVSHAYRGDEEDASSAQYHAWLDELLPLIPPGPKPAVLDLGCGCGIPVARRLAKTFAVTGVDISPVQIERARGLVPEATFLCQDMTALSFTPGSFAAIVAFYAIIHVPLAEQPVLLGMIYRWLIPGGLFMATLGQQAWTGTEENWLDAGGRMYWSHAGAETYREWLEAAGFQVRWTRFIPEGSGGHMLFLCEKAAAPGAGSSPA